jgi:predicted ATP-dependent endonuclease of OLD family
MHIQQVKIKNFRCFEDLTVNLNPDVNIFVGNNGYGKSAVLDVFISLVKRKSRKQDNISNKDNRS